MAKRSGPIPPRTAERASRGAFWKWGISLAVCLHLAAVVAEPFRFFTRSGRGTSPAADPLRAALGPYVEMAYLNHGYFFFAPEPGPSHLMACELELPDGRQGQLRFPDKRAQRPRLLYHRHFMLAEFLHALHVPPYRPELALGDPRLAQDWQAERQMYERVRDSMAAHVASKYGAERVRIERLEHRLPSDDEVFRQRIPLDAPELYITLPDAPLVPAIPEPATLEPGAGVPLPGVRPPERLGPLRPLELEPNGLPMIEESRIDAPREAAPRAEEVGP